MAEPLLTLTLWPEWVWAICHLDKRVENRSGGFCRQIVRRVGDGWLALHAGKSIGGRPSRAATEEGVLSVLEMAGQAPRWNQPTLYRDGLDWIVPGNRREGPVGRLWDRKELRFKYLFPDEVVTSAVVAICRVGPEVLRWDQQAPWKVPGGAGVPFRDVRVLREPVLCKGAQGLWRLPEDVQAAVEAQGVLGGR